MSNRLEGFVEWFSSVLGSWPVLGATIAGNPGWRWLVAFVAGVLVAVILRFVTSRVIDRLEGFAEKTKSSADDILVGVIHSTKRPFFVVLGVIAAAFLDNLGYNVSALLAGLGIVGVAVALALQNVLGDLFASLSIALDKPFVTGDFIIVDDKLGTVSRIGLKTTRVTSLSGEQLVFSNFDLLS